MNALRSPIHLHKQLSAIWSTRPGVARLAAVNHTVIGRRFMIASAVFFAIGGMLAMMIRTQLASGESPFMEPGLYAQVFTMHGTIMMFLFAIPMLEGVAMYLLPKLLGARDLAFPRLSAYGFWCYMIGGGMLLLAMLLGVAPDGGWFMYTPLSSKTYSPGINADVWLLGVTCVEVSSLAAAIEIMVSILKLRAPGMSLDRMPIFAWYMLVTAGMMLIAFPPLILGSILLEIERAFGFPFFDPTRGGDPLLWQHLFWLFGHPEVYIIFLPAAGVIATIIPVFAGRPLAGYQAIVVAIVALGFLSFGLWVHHMYTVGIPHVALGFFSAASALVAVPTAVQIFAWLATLAHGRPRLGLPMLYVFGFFFVFVMGGLTGVMLAMVPFDWQAHDSHFVVAHLHYVLVGGFVFPMLAAAYHWLPHLTGRLPIRYVSVTAFWFVFIGFNLTFFIMHLTGLRGMPRRVHTYAAESGLEWMNLVSSVGSFVMTIGFALVAFDLLFHSRFGRPFRRDPWQAHTLEWAMPIPPPAYNFASLPLIESRADMLEPRSIGPHLAAGRGYLGFVRHGWMETLGVDMASGRIDQVVVLPRQTFLPLYTALATGCVFVSILFKVYWATPVAAALVGLLFLAWARGSGFRADHGLLPVGNGVSAPPHAESRDPPARWAMIFTLLANGTCFASLLFGGLFLAVSAPDWPPPSRVSLPLPALLLVGGSLATAAAASRMAMRRHTGLSWLAISAAAHLCASVTTAMILTSGGLLPTVHAHAAVVFVVLAYVMLHALIGILFAVHGILRVRGGYVSPARILDLRLGRMWQDYTAVTGFVAIGFILLLNMLGGSGAAP